VEEREYLRDQRAKRGTKGAFQMAGPEVSAPSVEAMAERREERQRQPLHHLQYLDEVVVNPSFSSEVGLI
jgi:hypothetical protein